MEKFFCSNKVVQKHTNKNNCSFPLFDVENFYPSVSLALFNNAIQFAKDISDIPDKRHIKHNALKKYIIV